MLQLVKREQRPRGLSLGTIGALVGAMATLGFGAHASEPSRAETPPAGASGKDEKVRPKVCRGGSSMFMLSDVFFSLRLFEQRYEYAQLVDIIREHVSEFRATLKSADTRVPKAFPIKKIGISRIHAPNGVSTIRIEFVCPPFVDQEAILGRFLLNLQKNPDSRQSVEVFPVPPEKVEQKSIVEAYEQPSVSYLYANGKGSFQFVRGKSMQPNQGATFVFYKDEFLTGSEVNAIVEAYKEIYSYPHVHAFFRHDMSQSRRKMLADRGGPKTPNLANPAATKVKDSQPVSCISPRASNLAHALFV